MKKLVVVAASLLTLTAAAPARAGEASGLALSLRAGYAVPLGSAGDGARLNDLTSGAVPLQLDVGWRFDRHWQAGAYFSVGPALVADRAKDQLRADGATKVEGHASQRLGLQGTYTFRPEARFAPWAGLALGWEWTRYAEARLSSATGSGDAELGMSGFEGTLQAGGDYRLTPRFTVGPFASFSVGQYRKHLSDVHVKSGSLPDAGETSRSVGDKGIHEWLQLGVRGTFQL